MRIFLSKWVNNCRENLDFSPKCPFFPTIEKKNGKMLGKIQNVPMIVPSVEEQNGSVCIFVFVLHCG